MSKAITTSTKKDFEVNDDVKAERTGFMKKSGDFVLCVACREQGFCRLGITHEELLEDGKSLTQVKAGADTAGSPGVAHGGWTASVLDEAMGHLAIFAGTFTVTSTLTIEYLRPVPVERDLEAYCWVEKCENGRWYTVGELRLAGTEKALARAKGVFIERDASHFKKHQEWLARHDQRSAKSSEQ